MTTSAMQRLRVTGRTGTQAWLGISPVRLPSLSPPVPSPPAGLGFPIDTDPGGAGPSAGSGQGCGMPLVSRPRLARQRPQEDVAASPATTHRHSVVLFSVYPSGTVTQSSEGVTPSQTSQGSTGIFCKESDNSFRFQGQTGPVATVRLCRRGGAPGNLSLQRQAWGQIWPVV